MNKINEKLNDKEIGFPFIAVPVNFIYIMDSDCLKLMTILLQKESYWSSHNQLKDGYFIKSITELSKELNLINRKDIHSIIEALFLAGFITVDVTPRKFKTAKFKLNWEKIEEVASASLQSIREFETYITKLPRNVNYTYVTKCNTSINNDVTNNVTKCNTNVDNNVTSNVTNNVTKCNTTINNIENIYNINNKNNINNNLNNIYNINNKKEINNLNNIENFENMNINEKIDLLIKRMESSNLEELENKRFKFIEWIKFNLTPTYQEEIEKRIEERYNEIYEKNVKSFNNGLNDDFFSSIELNSSTGKTIKEESEEILEVIPTKSKEKLIEMMEEVITTSTGNVEEADNFKMWVDLNKNEINSYDLMDKAEETFQFLRNKQKEAVSATFSTQVDSLPTSRVDAVKSPKNGQYKDVAVERTIEVNGRVLRLVDSEPDLDIIDTIWSEMQASAAS